MPKTDFANEVKYQFVYDAENIATCKHCSGYGKAYQMTRQQLHLAECTEYESVAEPAFLKKVRLTLPNSVAHTARVGKLIAKWKSLYGVDGLTSEAEADEAMGSSSKGTDSTDKSTGKRKRGDTSLDLPPGVRNSDGLGTEYNALNLALARWAYKYGIPWHAINSDEFKEIIDIARPGEQLPLARAVFENI